MEGGAAPHGRCRARCHLKGNERTAQENFRISPLLSTSPALPWLNIMLYRLACLTLALVTALVEAVICPQPQLVMESGDWIT